MEVSVRIFIAFCKEMFTSSVFLSIYCLIRIWIGSVSSAFLNFKCESTSQQNCRGNFDNLLLLFGGGGGVVVVVAVAVVGGGGGGVGVGVVYTCQLSMTIQSLK